MDQSEEGFVNSRLNVDIIRVATACDAPYLVYTQNHDVLGLGQLPQDLTDASSTGAYTASSQATDKFSLCNRLGREVFISSSSSSKNVSGREKFENNKRRIDEVVRR